jgi:hypothetical protein
MFAYRKNPVAFDHYELANKLKKLALEEFPNAMNFLRPGFDD